MDFRFRRTSGRAADIAAMTEFDPISHMERTALPQGPAVSHEEDRQRTHLGLGSRRIASRVAAHMTVPRLVSVSCFGMQ